MATTERKERTLGPGIWLPVPDEPEWQGVWDTHQQLFFCLVCECWVGQRVQWEEHMQLSKHKRRVRDADMAIEGEWLMVQQGAELAADRAP